MSSLVVEVDDPYPAEGDSSPNRCLHLLTVAAGVGAILISTGVLGVTAVWPVTGVLTMTPRVAAVLITAGVQGVTVVWPVTGVLTMTPRLATVTLTLTSGVLGPVVTVIAGAVIPAWVIRFQ